MIHDPSVCRLGRKPVKKHKLTLPNMRKYLRAGMPPSPPVLMSPTLNWGMMKNDALGDCAEAAAGHLEMVWTLAQTTLWTPTDDQVVQFYEQCGGYNPNSPGSDQGTVLTDLLASWQSVGFNTHKIVAWGAFNAKDHQEFMDACYMYQGVYCGILLATEQQNQDVWDVVSGMSPGSWGGHCVPVMGYNATGPVCVTWGALKQMTWAFVDAAMEENYAIVSQDCLDLNKNTRFGVNLTTLMADLGTLQRAA